MDNAYSGYCEHGVKHVRRCPQCEASRSTGTVSMPTHTFEWAKMTLKAVIEEANRRGAEFTALREEKENWKALAEKTADAMRRDCTLLHLFHEIREELRTKEARFHEIQEKDARLLAAVLKREEGLRQENDRLKGTEPGHLMNLLTVAEALNRELTTERDSQDLTVSLLMEQNRNLTERMGEMESLLQEASKFFSPLHDFDGEKLAWIKAVEAIAAVRQPEAAEEVKDARADYVPPIDQMVADIDRLRQELLRARKSLRDEFAAAALPTLAAQHDDCAREAIAREAYEYADAMMKAREEVKP